MFTYINMKKTKIFTKREVIIREGDYGDEAYQIIRGKVKVTTTNKAGKDITLATLGEGDIFGEMALIDEKPRSANVIALEDVELSVTSKIEFRRGLLLGNEALTPILRIMFERLRTANETVSNMMNDISLNSVEAEEEYEQEITSMPEVVITPLTTRAGNALGIGSLFIMKYPFRIGRVDDDELLSYNDLVLEDDGLNQISLHHLLITTQGGKVYASDRGSRKGSIINGKRVGLTNRNALVELRKGDNEITLGDMMSPYKFNFYLS